jgi:hypothetical protein
MDRNRHMATRTATPTTTPAQGDLLVDFTTDLGPNCQPLKKVKPGTTVTAHVTIRTLTPAAGGRARGIIDGSQGWAIFTVSRDSLPRITDALHHQGWITIRGTVTMVGQVPTIDVWAARAVSV